MDNIIHDPCFLNTQCKHHGLIKAVPTVKHHRRIEIKCALRISRYFSVSYHLQVSIGSSSNICKATTVTHTKRINRNLLHKETSFVFYRSFVLRKSQN